MNKTDKMNFCISILMLLFFQSAWAQRQTDKDFNKSEVSLQSEKKTAEIEHTTQNGSTDQHRGCENHNIPKEYQHHDSQSEIEDYLRFVRNTQGTLGTRNAACIEIPVNIVVTSKSDGTGSDSDGRLYMVMETVNQMCRRSNLSIRFKITRLHRINDDNYYNIPTQWDKFVELRNKYTDYPRAVPLIIVGDCGGGGYGGVDWLAVTNKYYGPNVWLHEMCHFLGIAHTHDRGDELVNGSNCSTAGDLICDTPAEPNNGIGDFVRDCQYSGTKRDANNELYRPDAYNVMGYGDGRCQYKLTNGQQDRIRYFLRTKYPNIVTSTNCDGGGGGSCRITFKNTGCQTAELFWSDFDPRSFGTIAPNETKTVNSHGGMTWVMKVGTTEVGNYWTSCGNANYSFNGCTVTPIAAFSDTKCYRFNNRHSSKVMEVGGNSTENGGIVQQWSWLGSKSQVWRVKGAENGFYQIVNGNSGRVLNVADAGTGDGTPINQWEWSNGNHQKWKLTPNAQGYYTITAQHSGKTLDVFTAATNDGAKILHWAVNNQANQQWQIAETTCPAGTATGGGGTGGTTLECEANVNNGVWQILSSCAVTVPAGQRLELAVNPNGLSSYVWSGPNGFNRAGDANGNILISDAITPSQAGNYTVTVNNNGTTSTKTIQVTVTGGETGGGTLTFMGEANVNNGGWQILSGGAVTVPAGQRLELSANPNGASSYQWTGPNGFSGTGNSDGNILVSNAITSSQAGTYIVTFTSGGALASLPISVTVTGGGTGSVGGTCTLRFTNTGCQAALLILNDINGTGLVGHGSILPNSTKELPHLSDYAIPGATFVMKVGATTVGSYTPNCNSTNYSFNAGGCNPCTTSPVVATVAGNLAVCAGQTTVLTASGGATYKWSNSATTPSVSVGVGTYTVTATSATGCTATKAVTITQAPPSVSGTISSLTTTLASYTIPANFFTLSGQIGTIQKWEWSTNGTTWNNWGNANNTKNTVLTVSNVTNFYTRVLVKNGGCPVVYTPVKTVPIVIAPTTPCGAVTVVGGTSGTITVSGLGTNRAYVQVLNSLNQSVFLRQYLQPTVSVPIKNGIYSVKVYLYSSTWKYLCEKTVENIGVSGSVLDLRHNAATLDLTAMPELHRVQLAWVNNTGDKNDYFDIEKMNKTSRDFEKIATVNSKNGDEMAYYSAYDESPTDGDNTYRINLIGKNGTIKTSNITTVKFSKTYDFRIFPNPTIDFIDVDLTQYEGKAVTLKVYNSLSQIIYTHQVAKATVQPVHLELVTQNSGEYLLQVITQGRPVAVKKFIIQQ